MSEGRHAPPVEAFRLIFRSQPELSLDDLLYDLDHLRALLDIGGLCGHAQQLGRMPESELELRWLAKEFEETIRRMADVRVERVFYNSPLYLILSALYVAGYGGAAVYALRHTIDLVERWSEMRVRLAENSYRREAVNLLKQDLLADIQNPMIRDVLQRQVLETGGVDRAAKSLIQIESAVAISPPEPE
jgi:hypothetical protein